MKNLSLKEIEKYANAAAMLLKEHLALQNIRVRVCFGKSIDNELQAS